MAGRARPEDQPRLLAEALARAAAAPRGAVAVFDLDSTLLDNHPRQARILREYGAAAGLAPLLGARPEHWRSWDLEAAMIAAGVPPAVARRHREEARRFWAERFFTSAYCLLDEAIAGAPAFVCAVAAAGPAIAYVTGRPAGMEAGTREVLARAGFPPPAPGGARLLLKPDAALDDDAWKARAAVEVGRFGPVVLALDNEPAHANAWARAWPAALVLHVDTDDSGRPVPLAPGVRSVAGYVPLPPAPPSRREGDPGAPAALTGGAGGATAAAR